MIEKVANPLDFNLEIIEPLIAELQKRFDDWQLTPVEHFKLKESGLSMEIKFNGKTYSYNLEQLKKLKDELSDPVINAVKEFA